MDRSAVHRDVVTFNAVMSACENLGEYLGECSENIWDILG